MTENAINTALVEQAVMMPRLLDRGDGVMQVDDCRRGWRSFTCDCGLIWAEPTRDRLSPSGENCPKCDAWCVPIRQWHDRELKVDDFMNLI